ncbi:MAG: HipA domain-containing protein [Succinivibrio sp.]|nr:HipA domain-containing protein [Succinivibrio sp.]
MRLVEPDRVSRNKRLYGGSHGLKLGVCLDGRNYLLKFPPRLKCANSYCEGTPGCSNSPFSEFLGSRIYALLKIPVQEVSLACYQGRTVALCRDFVRTGQRFYTFEQYCLTTAEVDNELAYRVIAGRPHDLQLIKYNLKRLDKEEPKLRATERFWNMFVVDALIGNRERSSDNWGILEQHDRLSLAPVFDNGSCLFCSLSEQEIAKSDRAQFKEMAYDLESVLSIGDQRINPLQYLSKGEDPDAAAAFCRLYPVMDECCDKMDRLVRHTPQLPAAVTSFLADILTYRIEQIFRPCYLKLQG